MSSVHFSAIIVGFAILLVFSPTGSPARLWFGRLLVLGGDDGGGATGAAVIVGCALVNMIFNLNDGLVVRALFLMFGQAPNANTYPLPPNTSSLLLPRPHGKEPVSCFFIPPQSNPAIKTTHTTERILLRRRRQISNITKSTH